MNIELALKWCEENEAQIIFCKGVDKGNIMVVAKGEYVWGDTVDNAIKSMVELLKKKMGV